MTRKITHFVVLGDSASDVGITNSRGPIVRKFAGLVNASPLGRFSNARVWIDHLARQFCHQLSIQELKNIGLSATDIADGLIHQDKNVTSYIAKTSYKRHKDIYFKNNLFFRNYSEGGVTAVNYKWKLCEPYRFIYRLNIPCLDEKTTQVLSDDKDYFLSPQLQSETLVLEFISANDILQTKRNFSLSKIHKIIDARMQNIERFIQNNYKNFIFFNAIDLSLSPRYFEQPNADFVKEFCHTLNNLLVEEIKKITIRYPSCSFDVFDVNAIFSKIYRNPGKFQFDASKIHKSFKDSSDFKPVALGQTSHAGGYLFWDTVHPTDSLHFYLAESLNEFILKKYYIEIPLLNSKFSNKMSI